MPTHQASVSGLLKSGSLGRRMASPLPLRGNQLPTQITLKSNQWTSISFSKLAASQVSRTTVSFSHWIAAQATRIAAVLDEWTAVEVMVAVLIVSAVVGALVSCAFFYFFPPSDLNPKECDTEMEYWEPR